jgi:CO dehydrogenase/acetyl-CoA synthase delta subunit
MRVLLISANTERINMPVVPVGLGAVAVATQEAGHDVELLDLMNVEHPVSVTKRAVETFGPDVIGISVRNVDDQSMENPVFLLDQVREVIKDCRAVSEAPIVLGGAGYSIFPESALLYLGADMGIQGEGERAFPILLSFLERGNDLSRVSGKKKV